MPEFGGPWVVEFELLASSAATSIAPADWAPTALSIAPVTLKLLDELGGTVLKQTQV